MQITKIKVGDNIYDVGGSSGSVVNHYLEIKYSIIGTMVYVYVNYVNNSTTPLNIEDFKNILPNNYINATGFVYLRTTSEASYAVCSIKKSSDGLSYDVYYVKSPYNAVISVNFTDITEFNDNVVE